MMIRLHQTSPKQAGGHVQTYTHLHVHTHKNTHKDRRV
jgi:hypothetical protein